MYPGVQSADPDNPNCAESSAYPAAPDSEYGWEKLFSERLYLGVWSQSRHKPRSPATTTFSAGGGLERRKEKAPAPVCRKVAMAQDGSEWRSGDGKQTRSFLYVDGV